VHPGTSATPSADSPNGPPDDAFRNVDVCVIHNSGAGSGDAAAILERHVCERPDWRLLRADQLHESRRLVRTAAAAGVRRFIIAGGDGTVHRVVNDLGDLLHLVELAIVPVGTGNDLSRLLGMSGDTHESLIQAAAGEAVGTDVISLKLSGAGAERLVVNAASGGFAGTVGEKISHDLKQRWGPFAYVLSAAAALPELQPYRIELDLDGHQLNMDAYNIVIANGRFVAGGVPIAPDAALDDGLLDVVVLPADPWAAAIAVPDILMGRHRENDRVLTTTARRVRLRTHPAMPFTVDGEQVEVERSTFEVRPGGARFVRPPAPTSSADV
jgi:diacylglycerol kinase (ATP)